MTFPVVLAESGYSKSEIYHQNNSWNDLKLVTWIQDCLPVQRMTERAFFLKTQGCSSHLFIWPACISSWDQETGGRFVAGYCFLVQICKVRVETSLGYRRCSASGWNTAGFSDSSILPITRHLGGPLMWFKTPTDGLSFKVCRRDTLCIPEAWSYPQQQIIQR